MRDINLKSSDFWKVFKWAFFITLMLFAWAVYEDGLETFRMFVDIPVGLFVSLITAGIFGIARIQFDNYSDTTPNN